MFESLIRKGFSTPLRYGRNDFICGFLEHERFTAGAHVLVRTYYSSHVSCKQERKKTTQHQNLLLTGEIQHPIPTKSGLEVVGRLKKAQVILAKKALLYSTVTDFARFLG